MKKQRVTPLTFETYLAVIKNSVGSKTYRNFYANVNGKKTDIMRNGELSCAFYVSSILAMFKFTKGVHGTVDSTIKDLLESDWTKINKPKIGSVLVWEERNFGNNDNHKHIGFFIGNNKAISNSCKSGWPTEHNWNFNGKRKVELILWNHNIK